MRILLVAVAIACTPFDYHELPCSTDANCPSGWECTNNYIAPGELRCNEILEPSAGCSRVAPSAGCSGPFIGRGDPEAADDSPWVELASGERFVCARREGGAVSCWGTTPPEGGGGRYVHIAAGTAHVCGIDDGGEVSCWGDDFEGNTEAPSGTFTQLALGGRTSCGLREEGSIECWGDLRNADRLDAPGGDFVEISSGTFSSCARTASGDVVCFGQGMWTDQPPWREYADLGNGFDHSCAVRGGRFAGIVDCWGDGGSGSMDAPSGPFVDVEAGNHFTCGLREDGTLVCWGEDDEGQLDVPTGAFEELSVGALHGCAIAVETGEVVCWGYL